MSAGSISSKLIDLLAPQVAPVDAVDVCSFGAMTRNTHPLRK